MSSPYSGRAFKRLRDEWYKKLEDTDFKDCEDSRGHLKRNQETNLLTKKITFKPEIYELTISYYSWAESMLFGFIFKKDIDRIIWRYHSVGLSGTEIGLRVGYHRTWINRKIIEIRIYLKEQEK